MNILRKIYNIIIPDEPKNVLTTIIKSNVCFKCKDSLTALERRICLFDREDRCYICSSCKGLYDVKVNRLYNTIIISDEKSVLCDSFINDLNDLIEEDKTEVFNLISQYHKPYVLELVRLNIV